MAAKKESVSIHVINPRKKTGSRRKRRSKVTTRKNSSKKVAKKAPRKTVAKKAARKAPTMAKKRRKKSTTRRAPARRAPARRVTRRNPGGYRRKARRAYSRAKTSTKGGINEVLKEMKNSLPRMLGMLAAGWAVRRWSQTPGGIWPGQVNPTSPLMGEGWSLPQYAIAGVVAVWGPMLLGGLVPANEFRRGVVDLIVQKFIWTEGIARSPALQEQFGAGDVAYNGNQAYVESGGRWNAMQGLVESSPLDGLVESSALDGPVGGYGHLMPAGTGTTHGKYHGSGYTSAYHAAYQR